MRFIASFADRIIARVVSVNITHTYERLLEGYPSCATERTLLLDIEERRLLIESGKLKGYYCFEPELMDEREYLGQAADGPLGKNAKCLKDNKVSALLVIDGREGQYQITLEWYSSTRELTETPLPELVQQFAGRLKFCDIQKACKLIDWEDLT